MLVLSGSCKGMEMVVGRAGVDWISAHRRGDLDAGVPTAAVMAHPTQVEFSAEELGAVRADLGSAGLWRENEAYEYAPGRFRLRARRVNGGAHRVPDA